MKTIVTAVLLGFAAALSGCSMGLPMPPPWMLMLIHNDTTPAGTPDPATVMPMGETAPEAAPAAEPAPQPAAPAGERALA